MGGRGPTYVYPTALKEVVRARFSSYIKDWEDPTGPHVLRNLINNWLSIINVFTLILHLYHVTYKDLTSVKWPKK